MGALVSDPPDAPVLVEPRRHAQDDPFPADTVDEVLSVAFETNNSEVLYLVFHNESTRDVMERFSDHVDVMPEIGAGKTTFSVYRRTSVGELTRF